MKTNSQTKLKEKVNKKAYCIVCGIPWKDGKGFVGKHIFPCANERYGWNFTTEKKPKSLQECGECLCFCHQKSPSYPKNWTCIHCTEKQKCANGGIGSSNMPYDFPSEKPNKRECVHNTNESYHCIYCSPCCSGLSDKRECDCTEQSYVCDCNAHFYHIDCLSDTKVCTCTKACIFPVNLKGCRDNCKVCLSDTKVKEEGFVGKNKRMAYQMGYNEGKAEALSTYQKQLIGKIRKQKKLHMKECQAGLDIALSLIKEGLTD